MKMQLGELISTIFQLHVDTHFLHLTTEIYAEHKALDMAYESLGEFKDSISEKLIGYYGRNFKLNLTSPKSTIKTICDDIYSFAESLAEDPHSEFKNISEEIKALSAELRYLLTLA